MICILAKTRIATLLFSGNYPFRNSSTIYCTFGAFSSVCGTFFNIGIVIPLCWGCYCWAKTPFIILTSSWGNAVGSIATVCCSIGFIWTILARFDLVESLSIFALSYRKVLTNVTSRAAHITVYAIVCISLWFCIYTINLTCGAGSIVKTIIPWSNSWVYRLSAFNNQVIHSNFSAVTPLHNF